MTSEPFDQLLKEKMLELEQHEAEQEGLRNDAVEHLRLAALRSLAANGRTLPWHGAGGYLADESGRMTEGPHKLDVLF